MSETTKFCLNLLQLCLEYYRLLSHFIINGLWAGAVLSVMAIY